MLSGTPGDSGVNRRVVDGDDTDPTSFSKRTSSRSSAIESPQGPGPSKTPAQLPPAANFGDAD
jgi:hypothetical protein